MRTFIIICMILFLCLPVSFVLANNMNQDEVYGTNVHNDPRQGSVYKYEDPATGDEVISVRPGRKEKGEGAYTTSPMPIYVLPQITPTRPSVSPPSQP